MRRVLVFLLSLSFLIPLPVLAFDQADLLNKIEALSKELERLKQQLQEMQQREAQKEERITVIEKKAEQAAGPSWLEIGGDYRFRYDALKGKVHDYVAYVPPVLGGPAAKPTPGYNVKNSSLMTNRFGLNLNAKATEDIAVKARLLMYKVWGHGTENPIAGNFFGDRAMGVFDGTTGHVPQDNTLRVDQAYATWSNIGGAPVWFSVGRRPSTGGIPSNLRTNTEKAGTAGVPSLLVDYAFDGLTLGYAPDIDALPGAYVKFCYGKGYDSGFRSPTNSIKDTVMFGIDVVPYDTDNLHVELNWNRGKDIFDNLPDVGVTTNLGYIDWYGATVTGKVFDSLNLFASVALSKTHPNNNLSVFGPGLLYDQPATKKSTSGNAYYLGARYDIKSSGTKIGAEWNRGSKNWITFVPASDDIWTGKLGTRGDVYEVYIIQELNKKPIAKRGKAFFRLGYQYYNFKYTGSNFWLGEPKKISDLTTNIANPANYQMLAPLKNASDIYLTFDVLF